MDEQDEKEAYKEKLKSLGFRARKPSPKVTVDHTDTAIVTTTEHWHDRQDCNVSMLKPITMGKRSKESIEDG